MLAAPSSLTFSLSNGDKIEIQLVPAPRARSLRLVCSIAGTRLLVPRYHSNVEIESFLASKRAWITANHAYYEKLRKKCGGYDSNAIFYLGNRYSVRITKDLQTFATVSESMNMITFHVTDLKRQRSAVKQWYMAETTKVLEERLPALAAKMGLSYNRASVKDVTSRWASCSRNRNLSFSLLLSAAPLEVIDYVIIHELAHLARMDHSRHFWELVASVDPDFKKHRSWLSDYAPVVRLD